MARKRIINHTSEPNRNPLTARTHNKLAPFFGNILSRKKCSAPFVNTAKHRIGEPRCRTCLRAHELNALTHRNMTRCVEIEHLKCRNAQRHAHAGGNFCRLGDIAIERLVERARSDGYAQGKRQGKCFVACIGQRSCRSRQDVADKTTTIPGFHQRAQCAATRRRKLGHESISQVRASPCRPIAQALASI